MKKMIVIVGAVVGLSGCFADDNITAYEAKTPEYKMIKRVPSEPDVTFEFRTPVTEPAGEEVLADTKPAPPLEPTIPTRKYGTYSLTAEQQKVLLLAKKYGEEVGYPETIQSIAMQETLAGGYGDGIGDKMNGHLKRSYGVMQVKIATAQWVMKFYPEIVEEYFAGKRIDTINPVLIRDKLINDNDFNIRVGAYNFALMTRYTDSWREAVVAYNTGLGGVREVPEVDQHVYYKKIVHKLNNVIRPFNDHIDTNLLAMGE